MKSFKEKETGEVHDLEEGGKYILFRKQVGSTS
jgi:hypothetical protein